MDQPRLDGRLRARGRLRAHLDGAPRARLPARSPAVPPRLRRAQRRRGAGRLGQFPVSLANPFNRFTLTSLSFKPGISTDELIAFCELAAMRADSPAAADPKGWLGGRSVANIVFNEAVYLKAGDKGAG